MSYGQSPRYSGEAGEKYFEYQNSRGELGGRLTAKRLQSYIAPTDSVLDFGCGGGWLLKALTCRSKIGVEPNPSARIQCESNGVLAVAQIAEVHEKVDVVISNHSLEHVPYPIEALRQMRALLREEGRLVLVTPIDDWRMQSRYVPDEINHHLHTWNPQLIGNTLAEAGFRPKSIHILTKAWPPRVEALHRLLPAPIFEVACSVWGAIRLRRQLVAIAEPVYVQSD
jgi:2-polyprenyl-3-methyl-5-hydroxy-6-metoxy-1,4-benzoquinol methylase